VKKPFRNDITDIENDQQRVVPNNRIAEYSALFESYGFIHGCIIINDKELVIQNDSIGGHIHIITSLGTTFGFLCRRHFLANVLRVIGEEFWFCYD
jgi:hypothetical protein